MEYCHLSLFKKAAGTSVVYVLKASVGALLGRERRADFLSERPRSRASVDLSISSCIPQRKHDELRVCRVRQRSMDMSAALWMILLTTGESPVLPRLKGQEAVSARQLTRHFQGMDLNPVFTFPSSFRHRWGARSSPTHGWLIDPKNPQKPCRGHLSREGLGYGSDRRGGCTTRGLFVGIGAKDVGDCAGSSWAAFERL